MEGHGLKSHAKGFDLVPSVPLLCFLTNSQKGGWAAVEGALHKQPSKATRIKGCQMWFIPGNAPATSMANVDNFAGS